MKTVIVLFRATKISEVEKIKVSIPKQNYICSDAIDDFCLDAVQNKIGHHPRWIRIEYK
jgi:hypothetical protein